MFEMLEVNVLFVSVAKSSLVGVAPVSYEAVYTIQQPVIAHYVAYDTGILPVLTHRNPNPYSKPDTVSLTLNTHGYQSTRHTVMSSDGQLVTG